MFLQSYQTARDKLLYKDGFCWNVCWKFAGSWKFTENVEEQKKILMGNMK